MRAGKIKLQVAFNNQYATAVVILEESDQDPDAIIEFAEDVCATYHDGEEECLVIRFPDRPDELYTQRALRGSFTKVPA